MDGPKFSETKNPEAEFDQGILGGEFFPFTGDLEGFLQRDPAEWSSTIQQFNVHPRKLTWPPKWSFGRLFSFLNRVHV